MSQPSKYDYVDSRLQLIQRRIYVNSKHHAFSRATPYHKYLVARYGILRTPNRLVPVAGIHFLPVTVRRTNYIRKLALVDDSNTIIET